MIRTHKSYLNENEKLLLLFIVNFVDIFETVAHYCYEFVL